MVSVPNQPRHFNPGGFARLPLELLVIVAVAVLLPAAPRRVLAVVAGAALSAVTVVKVLDHGVVTLDQLDAYLFDRGLPTRLGRVPENTRGTPSL